MRTWKGIERESGIINGQAGMNQSVEVPDWDGLFQLNCLSLFHLAGTLEKGPCGLYSPFSASIPGALLSTIPTPIFPSLSQMYRLEAHCILVPTSHF